MRGTKLGISRGQSLMKERTMKTGKTSAATLGLVGGLVLGAWIGAEISNRVETPEPAIATVKAIEEPAAPAASAKPKRVIARRAAASSVAPRATSGDAAVAPMPESTPKLVMTIP